MKKDIKLTFVEKELVTVKFNQIDRIISALSGDVTGSPADNTVVKIRNKTVDAPVTGDDGKSVVYDETNDKFILDAGVGSDEKIKISSNDTTPGYLNGKLVAGSGITLTENNDGANETLSVINSDKGSDAISAHEITYDHSQLHAHSNKALLDTYTQTEADLADAISKEHEHANKSILDNIEQAFTTTLKNKLDGIESLAVALATVKADTDIADAITKKHIQGTESIVTKTANYTLTASDYTVLGDTNAFILTLPTAVGIAGKVYVIKKINTEYDEALTIATTGIETIDGESSYVLYTVNSGIIIQSNNVNWVIIGVI